MDQIEPKKATVTIELVYHIHPQEFMLPMERFIIEVFEDGLKNNVDLLSNFGYNTQAIGCESVNYRVSYD